MTRGTKILIFSLVGGGVLMMSICAGIVFLGFKAFQEIPQVMASGNSFLDQL